MGEECAADFLIEKVSDPTEKEGITSMRACVSNLYLVSAASGHTGLINVFINRKCLQLLVLMHLINRKPNIRFFRTWFIGHDCVGGEKDKEFLISISCAHSTQTLVINTYTKNIKEKADWLVYL